MKKLLRTRKMLMEMSQELGPAVNADHMSAADLTGQLMASATPQRPVRVMTKQGVEGEFFGEVVGDRLRMQTAPDVWQWVSFAQVASAQRGA